MMWDRVMVQIIFWGASLVTLWLILRRPYLAVRLGERHIRLQSYVLGALLGPVLILAFGLLSYQDVARSLSGDATLQPVGILALFLAMVFMSIFLDITGFFEMCARSALRRAHGDGRRLFFVVYLMVALLTTFTSNDIVILTITPFIYYFAREARLNPVPYLVAEFFAANTWSMMIYVGNPTNILLAGARGMAFAEYSAWMALPTVAAGCVQLLLLWLVFRRDLEPTFTAAQVGNRSSRDALTDRPGAILAGGLLIGCITLLALAPVFGLSMWRISVSFAVALLLVLITRDSYAAVLRQRLDPLRNGGATRAFLRIPWSIVPFVLSLFVTVEALHRYGYTEGVGHLFLQLSGGTAAGAVAVYGVASALAANLLNNIPMALGFTFVMKDLSGSMLDGAALATIIGSNLGANLTPLGALAGILWMGILREKGCPLSFGRFVGYGLLITPATLAAALCVLALQIQRLSG